MTKRILVVEDQEDNRRILRDLLVHGGFEVIEVGDGEQAVTAAAAHHPDVILMPISSSTFFPQNGNLIGIAVRSEFWDHDDWSSDDLIGTFTEYIYSPKLQNDGRWAECSHSVTTGDSVNDEATSHISFTYSFYPNKCEDIPPDLKDLYRYP